MKADLHLHSTASDGALSPTELMRWAKDGGLEAVSVTDHDTVDGVDEAAREARRIGLKFVPGIEISAFSICEIHVLGYGFAYDSDGFREKLEEVKQMRVARNIAIGERLKALGVNLDMDFAKKGLGRMNMAREIVKRGYAADINQAFEKYLGVGGKAYVEAKRITPMAAVQLIKAYGGFASVAHPKKYLLDKRLDMLIGGLKKYGLDGLEINYPGHSESDLKELGKLADKYRLLPTGGSDFHGEDDKNFVFDLDVRTARALKLQ